MEPELARLGHVALETPDLESSMEYFHDAVGFEEVDRDDGAVYLRAVDEFDHHSIVLVEAEEPGVDHVGWQAREADHVQAFADRLAEEGVDVTWVDAGEERGQGEAIRFDAPGGHPFEIYYEMEKPDPPEERRSRLRNRTYSPTTTNHITPNQIDHVQLWDSEALSLAEWMIDVLGFEIHEYYDEADGTRWGTFISAGGTKIEAAVIRDDGNNSPGLHHIAYDVESGNDLFEAHDVMNELGVPVDGFGQHSISRGKFLYTRDETTGHRIEFNDGGYVVHDPNWEPVRWEETDLEDRQWIGAVGGDAVIH